MMEPRGLPARGPRFGDAGVVRQGWYVLLPSRRLRARAKPTVVEVGERRVLAYRDAMGRARVVADRCPHLGADLALAKVTDAGLRCAFHGWCWRDEDGACADAPGAGGPQPRRLRQYAVEERWGFVWAWLGGGQPGIALPEVPPHLKHRVRLRAQRLRGSLDVVFSNGFDLGHFGPSHGIEAETYAVDAEPPWRISHHVGGTLPRRATFTMAGIGGKEWEAVATQHAGGIVHVRFLRPVEHVVAFAMRPGPGATARTQTMLFLQRRRHLAPALAFLWTAVLDDLRIMKTMEWTGAYAPGDATLERYARFMEAMPAW